MANRYGWPTMQNGRGKEKIPARRFFTPLIMPPPILFLFLVHCVRGRTDIIILRTASKAIAAKKTAWHAVGARASKIRRLAVWMAECYKELQTAVKKTVIIAFLLRPASSYMHYSYSWSEAYTILGGQYSSRVARPIHNPRTPYCSVCSYGIGKVDTQSRM